VFVTNNASRPPSEVAASLSGNGRSGRARCRAELLPLLVRDDVTDGNWASSRGAHKPIGALDAFPDVQVAGQRCLDAGASTVAFTDVLLRRGVREVAAVDVGYGQLVWRLQTDERGAAARPDERPDPHAEGDRRRGRPDRGRSVVHPPDPGAAR